MLVGRDDAAIDRLLARFVELVHRVRKSVFCAARRRLHNGPSRKPFGIATTEDKSRAVGPARKFAH